MPRNYFKLDLYFFEHPKVVDLSHAATLMFLASIAYANRRETDGFIARPVLRKLIDVQPAVASSGTVTRDSHEGLAHELVKALLWEPVEGGWQIHDFGEHNDTSEERAAKRAGDAERKRRQRQRRSPSGHVTPGQSVTPTDVTSSHNGRVTASEAVRGITEAEADTEKTETLLVRSSAADTQSPRDDSDILDAEVVPITDHPEANRLCNLLADAVHTNTGERPKIGKRWLDAARLLLDRDGYTVEQVEYLIRWSQADQFWRANILSMPKLREKRLQLIAKIRAEADRSNGTRDRLHAASVQELLSAGGGA